jgi:hypothetical protein
MLAVSGGRLVLLSTPFGKRGHFYEFWEHGGPDWLKIKVTAADVPRISGEWLERERAAVGSWWYRQEYEVEFLEPAGAYFDAESIARAFVPGPTLFPVEETHAA